MVFANAHNQPGRRFAAGSNRSDHLLGAFGLVSHFFLFFAMGMLAAEIVQAEAPEATKPAIAVLFAVALVLLIVRGHMVGLSTTKESIGAIWNAWKPALLIFMVFWAAPVHAQVWRAADDC